MTRTAPTEQVSTAAIDKLGAKPYRTRFPTNDEQDAELDRQEALRRAAFDLPSDEPEER